MRDRSRERICRARDRDRSGDGRFEILQLRLTVGELVVLQRHDIDFDLGDLALEIYKIVEGKRVDVVPQTRNLFPRIDEAHEAKVDPRIFSHQR